MRLFEFLTATSIMVRCKASTKSGKRCKLPCVSGDDVCSVHVYDDMPGLVPMDSITNTFVTTAAVVRNGCPHSCLDSTSYCCACRDTRRGDNGYCSSCNTRTAPVVNVVASTAELPLITRINQFLQNPTGDNPQDSACYLLNEIKDTEHELDILYCRLQSYVNNNQVSNINQLDILASVAEFASMVELTTVTPVTPVIPVTTCSYINEESGPTQ